jgi:hypothetical protein
MKGQMRISLKHNTNNPSINETERSLRHIHLIFVQVLPKIHGQVLHVAHRLRHCHIDVPPDTISDDAMLIIKFNYLPRTRDVADIINVLDTSV